MNAPLNRFPQSRNTAGGFYGAVDDLADNAWPMAMHAIAKATGTSPSTVRAFLDSVGGWHFGDAVLAALYRGADELVSAIDGAVHDWTHYPVNDGTRRAYGMTPGMSYLAGLVRHHALAAAMADAARAAGD